MTVLAKGGGWVNSGFLLPVGDHGVIGQKDLKSTVEAWGTCPAFQRVVAPELRLEEETEEGTVMERLRRKKDASNFRR